MKSTRFAPLAALAAAAVFATTAAHASSIYVGGAEAQATTAASANPQSAAAQAAIVNAVGDTSPDLRISVRNGVAHLNGWARSEADVSKATAVAAQVAGIQRVYANSVRVWSSDEI